MRNLAAIPFLIACLGATPAEAGFRSPESLVRNVYAYYGNGAPELSKGLPHDKAVARQFFEPSLVAAWTAPRSEPYDFLVQSQSWRLGAISMSILRRQFDKTYVAVTFDNGGRAVTLNFILARYPDGWVITDVESPHDSLRMFLDQFRN
ncbi:MAG: hypothetical protein JOY90_31230 [Bradyrhizobium sp.]|uniref:hypothetical protein n=1 Tax=Bradyrhizobium sp. TaxID=376 RepID=UPI001D7B5BC7|nr:hypothetical protein [Bradyrhizobium sp.]MBV9564886.1 hypothetical protein [Bradyrhizobium sp.]